MGTTAEKLTYLNTTKGKIKDSINLTGAGITNQDTFRSYASKLKLGLIDIINNGTDNLYSNFPKVSGIGSNLSLTPTYEAPMRNLPLGNTYQQTYTGKNLLPYPYESTGTTVNGITFTPQSDGSVLVNGTATAQATFPLYGTSATTNQKELTGNYLYGGTSDVRLRAYNHSGSGYTNLGTDTGNGVQINKTTYTTGYIELVVPSGTTINNVVIKPMMLMNLDDTTYEPYVGGVSSPNPNYPQAIQSTTGLQNVNICGKNLFDKNNTSNLLDNVSINNSTSVISDTNGFYSLKINCKPNTTYTISKVVSSRFIVAYSNNSTYTSGEVLLGKIENKNATSLTITTGSEAKLLYVFYSKLSDETTYTLQQIIDSIQIEESLTATEYEPYKGNTYEVNLGKNLFDTEYMLENQYTASGGLVANIYQLNDGKIEVSANAVSTGRRFLNKLSLKAGTYTIKLDNIQFTGTKYIAYSIRNFTTLEDILALTYVNNFNDTTLSLSFTLDEDTEVSFSIQPANNNAGTLSFNNIQLEKGTKSTSFSPYFTPIELNGINTYQDSIKKSTGKNLWQFSENDLYRLDATSYSILGNNSVEVTSTSGTWRSVKFLLNVPDGTYTFSVGNVINSNSNVANKRMTLSTFTNNGATRTVVKHINIGTPETITITNENDKIYALEFYSGHNVSLSNTATYEYVQIVSGSTALPYEPYGKVWYVEKQTGKVVLNGSETGWGNYTNGATGLLTFRKQLNEIKSYTQSVNIICDYFVRTKGSNPTNNQFMNRYGNNQNLEFVYTNITSLNDFKTWLNTHNVSVYFALTTPTINEITNEELINQLDNLYTAKSQEGTTNISITSEYLPMLLSASALEMTD